MTHLERERESQLLVQVLPSLSTHDLRQVRAWCADILAAGIEPSRSIAEVRGQVVHSEIIRREQSGSDDPRVAPVEKIGMLRQMFGKTPKHYPRDRALAYCTKLPSPTSLPHAARTSPARGS